MRYSLADYTLSITIPQSLKSKGLSDFTIGGKDNATDSVSVEYDNNQFTTESYATGAYVHNRNLSRVGKIRVSISQLNSALTKLKNFAKIFYENDYDGAQVALSQAGVDGRKNGVVFNAKDCYISKIPAQEFGENAGKQQWEFTCGEINFA